MPVNVVGSKLLLGDCLDVLKSVESGSVDMVLADLPYGTTACKWDVCISFESLWEQLHRVTKPNAAMCMFGSEPFSSALRMSNLKRFKYDWYLNKNWVTNHLNAKNQPMRKVEICSVFGGSVYYPQGLKTHNKMKNRGVGARTNRECGPSNFQEFTNYPHNLLPFIRDKETIHPTQKPIALLEYLIKTYTNEGDTVLDPTMGSGSTGVACKNLGRKFIGIEMDEKYFEIAKRRIEDCNLQAEFK